VFLRKKTILDNKTMRNLIRTTSVPIPPGLTQPDGLRVSRIGLPALNFMKVALYSALLLVAALAPHDLFADCLTVQSPGNKAVACDAPWDFDGPNVTGNPTNCPCELGGFVIFVLSTVTNGNCLQYNITRTWQVSNSCGESHTCFQTVAVINTNQPVFYGATNINLYSCGSTQVFFNVTATESCCGSLPVTCGPPSGYSFPPGATMVGCSTIDCCGRTFNTTFYVYVHPLGVFSAYCPDKYVALGETNWTFDPPIVSDECCPGNYTFVPQTPVTNQASGLMIVTEVWGVTDGCSRGAYCTETVYVTNPPPYSIPWHKVAGGGGASAGGVYAVSGTAGQWDAGKLSGGNVNLSGGFWVLSGSSIGTSPQYTIVDLGTLGGDGGGYPGSEATDINNSGQIVGYAYTAGNAAYRAVFWTNSSSILVDLGTLGGASSEAWAINDVGQIVGDADPASGTFQAAFWANSGSSALGLGNLGGGAQAVGINNSGQIVGTAYTAGNAVARAAFWPTANSQPLDLGTLGGAGGDAYSINAFGQIVGDASPVGSSYFVDAAFWPNASSAPQDLGNLGYAATHSYVINNSGQIVGTGFPSSNTYHAVFWANSTGAGVPLVTPGSPQSEAYGLNASGQIVGWAGDDYVSHAAIWPNSSSAAVDLNSLIPPNSGWVLEWANAINDSGEIVGVGRINGHERAFALKPSNVGAPSVTGIAAGILHSLFVKSDGSLWVMGDNESGDLGDGTTVGHNTPQQIVSSGVTAVAAGAFQSFFIKSDGSLWAMGNNQFGQLGDGTSTDRAIPVQIVPNNVTAIAAGFYHSLFLKSDGSLWAMGMNVAGQLGDGTTTGRASPVQVVSSGVTAIAAGYSHSLFLKSDGSLWAMGNNLHGELGDGTTTFSAVPKQIMSSGVSGIAAGYDYSFFLKSDGSLWAVGYNGVGQLGDGTTSDVPVPKEIVSIGVTAIATSGLSDSHSLLLQTDGSLLGMGFNAYGELGDGTTAASHIPKPIVCAGVTAIACGDAYSLFVKSDGSLWGMGYNGGGQLGDGTTTDHHTPEQIVGGLPGAPIPALLITSVARVGNDLLLSFASESCRTYNVLSTLDLAGGTWNVLQTGIAGNGGIVQVTIPNALVQPQQFFRIQQAQ
jgi:probable HAF family extracellular repeat protein